MLCSRCGIACDGRIRVSGSPACYPCAVGRVPVPEGGSVSVEFARSFLALHLPAFPSDVSLCGALTRECQRIVEERR
jgi:hypothetical protein